MQKKERRKPLSLFGLDFEGAVRSILSVNPKRLKNPYDKPPLAIRHFG